MSRMKKLELEMDGEKLVVLNKIKKANGVVDVETWQ